MQGRIISFSIQENKGIITSQEGKRYYFTGTDWKEKNIPTRGLMVDFDVDSQQQAVEIFLAISEDIYQKQDLTTKTNGNIACAIIALVISIFCFIVSVDESFSADELVGMIFFVLLSVILGVITIKNKYEGKGMAISAIILSCLSFLFLIDSL